MNVIEKTTKTGVALFVEIDGRNVRVASDKVAKAGPKRPDKVKKAHTKGAPVCTKDETHGPKRVTPRGTVYCLICDREQAAKERAARLAKKAVAA